MSGTHFNGPVDSKEGFKVNGVEVISQTKKVTLGTSATPIAHTVQTEKVLESNTTQSSTSGTVSYEPILISSVLTGAGQVGGRSRFYMETGAALGGWANALKGEVKFTTNGRVTGLASAVVAEMTMPGKALTTGNYAPLELELNLPTSFTTAAGTPTSFIYASAQGAAAAAFDTGGYVMNIQGLTAGAGKIITAGTTLGTAYGSMRVRIGTTDYWIPLYAAEAS